MTNVYDNGDGDDTIPLLPKDNTRRSMDGALIPPFGPSSECCSLTITASISFIFYIQRFEIVTYGKEKSQEIQTTMLLLLIL